MHPMIRATLWHTLKYLDQSIVAEQMFCSLIVEMSHIPPFSRQSSLATMVEQNHKTSYYRNLAAGHLRRLLTDPGLDPDQTLMWVVQSLTSARNLDAQADKILAGVHPQEPAGETFVVAAKAWNRQRRRALKYAARTLQTILPTALWQEGVNPGRQDELSSNPRSAL